MDGCSGGAPSAARLAALSTRCSRTQRFRKSARYDARFSASAIMGFLVDVLLLRDADALVEVGAFHSRWRERDENDTVISDGALVDVDTALRQPDERAAVLAHLGTAEVRAAASLEHAALTEATRAWRPVGSNRRRHNIVIDNDAREVNARCAEVASLLRRHPRAPRARPARRGLRAPRY